MEKKKRARPTTTQVEKVETKKAEEKQKKTNKRTKNPENMIEKLTAYNYFYKEIMHQKRLDLTL